MSVSKAEPDRLNEYSWTAVTVLGIGRTGNREHVSKFYESLEHSVENGVANPTRQSQCVQAMALKLDWSSLDNLACYVMPGDGFVINNYGHPSFLRYIEGNRVLTLSYHYVDETAERGRRFLFFRRYAIHVQIPTEPAWDNGVLLTEGETTTVLDRICRTFQKYKKRSCRAVVNDKLYEQLAAIDRDVARRRRSSPVTGR